MGTRTSAKHNNERGSQNGKWYQILKLIPPEARVIALIALISDGVVIAVLKLLPQTQRIYGFVVFACILFGTLIGTVFVIRRSVSRNHNQPNLAEKVTQLADRLVEDRFLPGLIVAIPRGGLVVAGILARQLGNKAIVPIISLVRFDEPNGFKNPFNRFGFALQDFGIANPVKILIVDDICRSGRTLAAAMSFVEGLINNQLTQNTGGSGRRPKFEIKTAAISFYRTTYRQVIEPNFFIDRPAESILDASGEEEEM